MRACLVLFVVGAILGTACDQIHVQFGVLWYPRPFMLGQAWWVPPLFGGAGIALSYGPALILRALPAAPPPARPGREIAIAGASFVAAYFATGVFSAHPLALAAGLAAAWAARLVRLDRREAVGALVVSLTAAAAGSLFEAALSSTGAFFYHRPDALGVPIWLPSLYLHVALLGRAIARVWLSGR
ncbi:MAG: hypothetical protein AABZ30_04455 [Myxococcota bacterium]